MLYIEQVQHEDNKMPKKTVIIDSNRNSSSSMLYIYIYHTNNLLSMMY